MGLHLVFTCGRPSVQFLCICSRTNQALRYRCLVFSSTGKSKSTCALVELAERKHMSVLSLGDLRELEAWRERAARVPRPATQLRFMQPISNRTSLHTSSKQTFRLFSIPCRVWSVVPSHTLIKFSLLRSPTMAQQPTRHSILPSSRPSSSTHSASHQSQYSSALQSRIAQKRQELQHLQQLHELSSNLAAQMTELETKLGTLRDGAEAVACVMKNWEGVLGVISMAGGTYVFVVCCLELPVSAVMFWHFAGRGEGSQRHAGGQSG